MDWLRVYCLFILLAYFSSYENKGWRLVKNVTIFCNLSDVFHVLNLLKMFEFLNDMIAWEIIYFLEEKLLTENNILQSFLSFWSLFSTSIGYTSQAADTRTGSCSLRAYMFKGEILYRPLISSFHKSETTKYNFLT